MKRFKSVIIISTAISAAVASADPPTDPPADATANPPMVSSREPAHRVPAEPVPVPEQPEPDASTARGAPRPGSESGRIEEEEPTESVGRQIGRVALYVPRFLFELATLPVTGTFYAVDRYQLEDRYYRLFYNRERNAGIVPTATYTTGYGLTVGALAFHDDTFGDAEHSELEATTGFEYRVGLRAAIDTGVRFDPVKLGISGNFDRRPAEPFYGIGNNGDTVSATGHEDINPLVNPTAIGTYYRYQEARAAATADWSMFYNMHLLALGSITQLEYTASNTGPSIQDVYDPMTLNGFDTKTDHVYGQLELAWDTRHPASRWEPMTVHGVGSLVLGYGGISHQLDSDIDFWHYGVELQHYIHLGLGPRVLVARFHGEAVTGNLDEIPISELPMLGGAQYLRGYSYARFRDRMAGMASLQYMWSLTANSTAYLFTDAGRVWRGWDDLSVDEMHAGFGLGLMMYGGSSFLVDLAVASSTDGGIAFTAEFTPVLDERQRWR
ncbi:MAG TPA: BamA/TamA family outer membrane protein [Kofleriaceae bacterium]|nr:BamA/TamA family outer membrane protein [Kofleriaceae bacterium]